MCAVFVVIVVQLLPERAASGRRVKWTKSLHITLLSSSREEKFEETQNYKRTHTQFFPKCNKVSTRSAAYLSSGPLAEGHTAVYVRLRSADNRLRAASIDRLTRSLPRDCWSVYDDVQYS